jgi:hypothetical protein
MADARQPLFPDGHFYSPIIDVAEAEREAARIWPEPPEPPAGIDFRGDWHEEFLGGEFARLVRDYDYPDDLPPGGEVTGFYNNNPQYGLLDARALFVMLRWLRPRKMVEVGSGYTSLLSADVNCRFLGGRMEFTCVEPYPQAFLRRQIPGITRLIEARAQDVSADDLGLCAGDVLFIDTSHVAKLGSDVNHLYFNVLPKLAPGVIVHIHDIPLPCDYPIRWIRQGRCWNEQYVVRALLMDSPAYRVVFASRYAYLAHRDTLARALGGTPLDGCSLWLECTGARLRADAPHRLLDGVRTRHLAALLARRLAARFWPF